ncbi:MAG: histidine kinase, partial [Verrucomicrobiales bacterium]|nr:histidine kinase [Verrucomicrobiales bacterium]
VYTMGLGEGVSIEYERLRPGDYRFVVEGIDIAGGHSGRVSSVDVRVTRPYWEEIWFWGVTLIAVAGVSSFLVRRVVRKRIERERQENQLIADERLRIARDLHDDLGTRLSHIYLLGSQAESANTEGGARERFRQITQMSGELIGSLSETVWMLNANNGDLESLVNFLCRLVGELCKLSEIRCRIDALSVDETMPVSHEFRHSISLAVKETINNALKHSSASEIQMKVSKQGTNLRIVVRDNGVGIDPSSNSAGSGLESVTQRMRAIGGTYSLEELSEGGVRVVLEAPILA